MASSKTMLHTPNGMGLKRASLGRQGSVMSLTLEELQNSMLDQGKIGSMNMDEFMKNVWNTEENQSGLFAGGNITTTTNNNNSTITNNGNGNDGGGSSLQRQSSVTVPRTLSQRTVDEVWKEIQVQKQKQQSQELSLGEMTLEDFLIRAGVVKEDTDAGEVMAPIGPQGTLQDMPQSQEQAEWYNYQVKQQQLMQQQQQQQAAEAAAFGKRSPVGSLIMPAGGYFEGGYDAGPMTPGALALSPGIGTPDTPSKKRSLDLVVEKTVERRQRRMIKNRESAARSRARKQAYTVELEAEVTQLKEENTRLKRWEAEEAERRRKQITEIFLSKAREEPEGQKRELRRKKRLEGHQELNKQFLASLERQSSSRVPLINVHFE